VSNPVLDRDRVELLARRENLGTVFVSAWPRQEKDLPLVEVEVGWVRFSTMNHRTRAEQMSVIHRTGHPDLFTADPLGEEAQQAQYEILCGQDNFSALKADLKERGQQADAILTADGVLINGNRRSAALRSLYRDDDYLNARYVRCLVLPEDATMDELVDLEAELQVAREFKEAYSWINEALLIKELYDREGKDFDRVAKRMHRNVADVRSKHEKLQQALQLVAMSGGARMLVDFEENESAFDELAKHIRNKSATEAESVRNTYFLGTLANVQYRKLRHLRRNDAAELVHRELESDPALQPLLAMDHSKQDDALDDLLGPPTPRSPLAGVLNLLSTKRPEETITLADGSSVVVQNALNSVGSAISAAADEASEEHREQTTVKEPIERAKKAANDLARALAALPRARALQEWDESALREQTTRIRELLKEIEANS